MSLGETLQNVKKSRKPYAFPESELWLFFNLIPTKSQGSLIIPCPLLSHKIESYREEFRIAGGIWNVARPSDKWFK